ncbi:rCG30417 [Rattus norvegicus]|uniref:RCG30417 n=1 Tax=Rattus norvegicus TaxID=10116 RepID=A6JFF3_RAT|nr:rCG30417 [Rattus norvegicus]
MRNRFVTKTRLQVATASALAGDCQSLSCSITAKTHWTHNARPGVSMLICREPECVSIHRMCAWSLWGSEEGIRSPETQVTGRSCKLLCGCWGTVATCPQQISTKNT